jgi:hypothetical protein
VKRALVGIFLIPGMLAIGLLAVSAPMLIDMVRGPSDDPSLLCRSADPSPVAVPTDAQLVLQACAAGKAFTIRKGEKLAVDLTGSGDVDTSGTFHDLSVSDSSILRTVIGPKTVYSSSRGGITGRFFDYVAVYVGVRTGQSTTSALLNSCINAGCHDTNRWQATVKVT